MPLHTNKVHYTSNNLLNAEAFCYVLQAISRLPPLNTEVMISPYAPLVWHHLRTPHLC